MAYLFGQRKIWSGTQMPQSPRLKGGISGWQPMTFFIGLIFVTLLYSEPTVDINGHCPSIQSIILINNFGYIDSVSAVLFAGGKKFVFPLDTLVLFTKNLGGEGTFEITQGKTGNCMYDVSYNEITTEDYYH